MDDDNEGRTKILAEKLFSQYSLLFCIMPTIFEKKCYVVENHLKLLLKQWY